MLRIGARAAAKAARAGRKGSGKGARALLGTLETRCRGLMPDVSDGVERHPTREGWRRATSRHAAETQCARNSRETCRLRHAPCDTARRRRRKWRGRPLTNVFSNAKRATSQTPTRWKMSQQFGDRRIGNVRSATTGAASGHEKTPPVDTLWRAPGSRRDSRGRWRTRPRLQRRWSTPPRRLWMRGSTPTRSSPRWRRRPGCPPGDRGGGVVCDGDDLLDLGEGALRKFAREGWRRRRCGPSVRRVRCR